MKNIYELLNELDIPYREYKHPAVFTVEEAAQYDRGDGVHSKNLFLRNKKGNRHYLVIFEGSKKVDLKNLAQHLKESDLSFASPERLLKYLNLTPGSVSPLGLINDESHEVCVVVDSDLLRAEKQGFHPNTNTATLVISTSDFRKFLDSLSNKILYIDL